MKPNIEFLEEKKLIGKRVKISLVSNKTGKLWKSFMSERNKINNNLTSDFISMSIYNPTYFKEFKSTNEFEKWATIEVSDFENVPSDMETFILESGLYAVFKYKGSSDDNSIFNYIFGTWLPNSNFLLDERPHFEILGENYKNSDINSEEEIWIPIKEK